MYNAGLQQLVRHLRLDRLSSSIVIHRLVQLATLRIFVAIAVLESFKVPLVFRAIATPVDLLLARVVQQVTRVARGRRL